MKIKLIHSILLLIALLGFTSSLTASNKENSISGIIKSTTGETLPGSGVVLKEITKGAISDIDGKFRINTIPTGTYTLEVSCIGFTTYQEQISFTTGQQIQRDITLHAEDIQLGNVQVIGKAATRRVREQAYQVSSISAKDMFNTTADAKDVMKKISGVNIQEDGGLGSSYNFSLNGFSGDQVKFFLDGIPMDNFGSSMNLGDLPVNMIERVDVYKGVVPVWLGTDALGGAINIQTNKKAKYLDVSYSYGSFNTHRASINGAYTWRNGFTLRGNLFYNYSDNDYKVYVAKGNGDNEKKWYSRFNDAYQSGTAKIDFGFVDKTWADQLLFGFTATGNHKQEQTGATMAKVYGGVLSESKSFIPTLKYKKQDLFTEGLSVSLYSSYSFNETHAVDTLRGYSYDWSGTPTITPNSNDGEMGDRTFTILNNNELTIQLNASYAISTKSSVVLNYALSDYHRTVSDSLNPDNEANFFPKNMMKQTLGLAYKYDPTNRLSYTLFAKYYHLNAKTSKLYDRYLPTQRTDELINKQGSLGYGVATGYFVIPNLQLKLSYEHALRMPTPLEMFGDGLFVVPNADLEPEKSDNLNLGFEYDHTVKNHSLHVGGSFVYRNARDLIYNSVSPGSPESSYANSSKVRVLGTEADFQYEYKKLFHTGFNITYQSITDQADSVFIKSSSGDYYQTNFNKGYKLPNTPYLFGHFNAGVSLQDVGCKGSNLSFDYYLNYTEKYYLTWVERGTNNEEYVIPQQWSSDVQISYSFKHGKYNISARCSNLFNTLLYDKYYLQKPGRAFNIKLRYSI
ncbi:MAG: TonB-dependent receptor [Mangrovibacterium sp.]